MRRVVVDTHTLIVALLDDQSSAAQLLQRVVRGELLLVFCQGTAADLALQLMSTKFDAYLELGTRQRYVQHLRACSIWYEGRTQSTGTQLWIELAQLAQVDALVMDDGLLGTLPIHSVFKPTYSASAALKARL